MTTTTDLERAVAAAGLTTPVRWDEVTGSTNDTALELAGGGAPEWMVVAAGHQTAGRGRLGRTWRDRPGNALMFSVILRPDLVPAAAGLLSLLAGASMAEAAPEASGEPIRCKWPNDLMAGAGKVGGILAESVVKDGKLGHVVIGLGVNLTPPEGVEGAAGIGADVDPMAVLTAFLRGLRAGYHPGEPAFARDVVRRWSAVSATLGHEVEATRSDGQRVRGRAVALDGRGGLILETADGPATIAFGEVAHLR